MGRKLLFASVKKLKKLPLILLSLTTQPISPKLLITTTFMVLNLRTEISNIITWTSLGCAFLTSRGKDHELVTCRLCDQVMKDILIKTEVVGSLKCNSICFFKGKEKCIEMCEKLKELQQSAETFPCVAAAYCNVSPDDEVGGDAGDGVPSCKMRPIFKCEPSSHCRKRFRHFRLTCELKPGIAKWIHLKRSMAANAGSLAFALKQMPRCSDEGAMKTFCIADPEGKSFVSEAISWSLMFIWGGFGSLRALKTVGGDDDQKWLSFWLIVAFFQIIEGYLRVILSFWFPPYYHVKCIFVLWLICANGAEKIVRFTICIFDKFKRYFLLSRNSWEEQSLTCFARDGLLKHIDNLIVKNGFGNNTNKKISSRFCRFYDQDSSYSLKAKRRSFFYKDIHKQKFYTEWTRGMDDLCFLYRFISEHKLTIEEKFGKYKWWPELKKNSNDWIDLTPKFLRVCLVDATILGQAVDPYVRVSIVTATGEEYCNKRTHTRFCTNTPVWNEHLEIVPKGGFIDSGGVYHCRGLKDSVLVLRVGDENGRIFSVSLHVLSTILSIITPLALLVAFLDFPYFTTEEYLLPKLQTPGYEILLNAYQWVKNVDGNLTTVFRMQDGRIATPPLLVMTSCIVILQFAEELWRRCDWKDRKIGEVRVPFSEFFDRREHFRTESILLLDAPKGHHGEKGHTDAGIDDGEAFNVTGKLNFAIRLLES